MSTISKGKINWFYWTLLMCLKCATMNESEFPISITDIMENMFLSILCFLDSPSIESFLEKKIYVKSGNISDHCLE